MAKFIILSNRFMLDTAFQPFTMTWHSKNLYNCIKSNFIQKSDKSLTGQKATCAWITIATYVCIKNSPSSTTILFPRENGFNILEWPLSSFINVHIHLFRKGPQKCTWNVISNHFRKRTFFTICQNHNHWRLTFLRVHMWHHFSL